MGKTADLASGKKKKGTGSSTKKKQKVKQVTAAEAAAEAAAVAAAEAADFVGAAAQNLFEQAQAAFASPEDAQADAKPRGGIGCEGEEMR